MRGPVLSSWPPLCHPGLDPGSMPAHQQPWFAALDGGSGPPWQTGAAGRKSHLLQRRAARAKLPSQDFSNYPE